MSEEVGHVHVRILLYGDFHTFLYTLAEGSYKTWTGMESGICARALIFQFHCFYFEFHILLFCFYPLMESEVIVYAYSIFCSARVCTLVLPLTIDNHTILLEDTYSPAYKLSTVATRF